jgi:hypothetical protein
MTEKRDDLSKERVDFWLKFRGGVADLVVATARTVNQEPCEFTVLVALRGLAVDRSIREQYASVQDVPSPYGDFTMVMTKRRLLSSLHRRIANKLEEMVREKPKAAQLVLFPSEGEVHFFHLEQMREI